MNDLMDTSSTSVEISSVRQVPEEACLIQDKSGSLDSAVLSNVIVDTCIKQKPEDDISNDKTNSFKIKDKDAFAFKTDEKIGISDIKAFLDDDCKEDKFSPENESSGKKESDNKIHSESGKTSIGNNQLYIMLLENISYKLIQPKLFFKIRQILGFWCKIKYVRNNHLAYLGFETDEDRQKGISILQGFKLKKRNLVCTAITPDFDPFNPNHHKEYSKRTYLSDTEDADKDQNNENDKGSDDKSSHDGSDGSKKEKVEMETVLLKTGERVTRPVEDRTDYYHYLETGEYTSEKYKIVVQNIPKHCTHARLRDTLKRALGFNPKKVKYDPKQNFAFLACKDEDDRQKAIELLNKFYWKGRYLKCKMAAPNKDPYLVGKKRKMEMEQKEKENKKAKLDGNDDDELPPEDRIVQVVCPYAKYNYDEQLRLKQEEMVKVIEKLTVTMQSEGITPNWKYYMSNQPCLKLQPIIRSPIITEYRNKVEFTIGIGPDDKDNTVGFRIGSYTEGSLMIVEPTKCINCTKEAIILAKEFQEFIRTLPHPSFNTSRRQGFWQQLTIRTATTGQIMVIVQINRNFLTEEENEILRKQLLTFYHRDDCQVEVTSVCIAASALNSNYLDLEFGIQRVCKESYIHEKMLGLNFRISPEAFFQVNTPAAEILYKTVYDWCDTEVDDVNNACILDLCCGTGTIGLYLASKTGIQVKGIDISKQAIEDAIYNAQMNNVSNVHYIANHAERALIPLMNKVKEKDVIAVVDPPRAGLHRKVINSLRFNEAIKKVIYVSCSARQAIDNWVMLCRPPSKRIVGTPFRTVRAVPVDLFPQTPHCELIVELERINIYEEKLKEVKEIDIETNTKMNTEINTIKNIERSTGMEIKIDTEIKTEANTEVDIETNMEKNMNFEMKAGTEISAETNIVVDTNTNTEN